MGNDKINFRRELEKLLGRPSLIRFLELPPPQDSSIGRSSRKQLLRIGEGFAVLWHSLARGDLNLPLREGLTVRDSASGSTTLREQDLWDRMVLVLASYYDYIARILLQGKPTKGERILPGFRLPEVETIVESMNLAAKTKPLYMHWTAGLTVSYFTCLITTHFVGLLRNFRLPEFSLATLEQVAHNSLGGIYRYGTTASSDLQRIVSGRLLGSALAYLREVYQIDRTAWNLEHHPGVFSSIRLGEMGLLARRDAMTVKKYGAKRVETLFEHQLALVAQSLGFYVISTKSGERRVDLLCVSADPREQATLLVEAKTSSSAYALPAKDQRALIEYARDVQKSLTTLPPLRLILVVGSTHGPNLAKKLAAVETETMVPCRFISAQNLAHLREVLPGPVPVRVFVQRLLASKPIVGASFVDEVKKGYESLQEAHSVFVRSLLSPSTLSSESSKTN